MCVVCDWNDEQFKVVHLARSVFTELIADVLMHIDVNDAESTVTSFEQHKVVLFNVSHSMLEQVKAGVSKEDPDMHSVSISFV